MIKRWMTALIGIPVLILCVTTNFANEILGFIVILICGFILNFEIMRMCQNKKYISYPSTLMSIMISISCLLMYLFAIKMINVHQLFMIETIMFLIFFYIVISKELIKAHNFSNNIESIGFNLLIYISIVLFYPSLLLIIHIVPNKAAFFLLFGFTWFSDAMGLFTGKFFGKTKLTMLPSKSKTLEGYLGSLIFTFLLGISMYYLQGILYLPFHWSLIKWMLFGLTMNITANIGDLLESLIKRWLEVKDSGTILPGIGGIFDAIDSQIYSSIIALLFFISI